jgi:hypothetical protein
VNGRCPRSGFGIGNGFLFLLSAMCVVSVGVVVLAAGLVVCVVVCDWKSDVVVGPCAVDVDDVVEVDAEVDAELPVDDTRVVVVVVVVVVEVDEVVVVVPDVDDEVVVDVDVLPWDVDVVVVVEEQSRKLPLSLPFEPLPWLSSQFPCPPPLCTHGSPPYPGGHSGAVSVSPRRSLPACVLVVDCGGAVGPATAIAASVPAPKTPAPRTTDTRAFFMRGLTAPSILG